jgi:hypothetical protein
MIKEEFGGLKEELKRTQIDLEAALDKFKSDIIRWLTFCWVIMMLTILGLYFK